MAHVVPLVLGNFGITVNAYAPGAVDTEMSRLTALQQRNMEEVIKLNVACSAVDYVGQPEDVTGLVSYLASKEARYMTGQTLRFYPKCCLIFVLIVNLLCGNKRRVVL